MAGGGTMPQQPMMGGGSMPPMQPQMMGGGMPPAQPYAMGGQAPRVNPIGKFFSDINMVEAGLLALGVATFLYAISYYRHEIQMSKSGYADLSSRMQKIESEMAAKKAQEMAANANNMARRTKKRMLI
jgi:hypothetical protein